MPPVLEGNAPLQGSEQRQETDMNELGVEVKTSTLPNAGLGLFTTKQFHRNDIVCQYRGRILTTAEALHVEDKSYSMRLGNDVYVDARESLDVLARYINDCRSRGVYNVEFEKLPELQVANVRALRDIPAGRELFANYGKWYWVAYNLAHPDSPVK
ncbi:hypothetical protein LEN26_006484 [Aphanomyces euteiches]|nr:hypothetical protein AeMF1_010306 [Aphanomyces euteiches]KAH9135319.1 hypothetical protein LEN26_006484 [Aphanomyces euteiches]KAH9189362.1 hypothetical protein AeNC1_008671 [Aphanomyces euteiches]